MEGKSGNTNSGARGVGNSGGNGNKGDDTVTPSKGKEFSTPNASKVSKGSAVISAKKLALQVPNLGTPTLQRVSLSTSNLLSASTPNLMTPNVMKTNPISLGAGNLDALIQQRNAATGRESTQRDAARG